MCECRVQVNLGQPGAKEQIAPLLASSACMLSEEETFMGNSNEGLSSLSESCQGISREREEAINLSLGGLLSEIIVSQQCPTTESPVRVVGGECQLWESMNQRQVWEKVKEKQERQTFVLLDLL